MDPRTRKLGHVLQDNDAAAALVEIGIDTPAKVKKATDTALRKARGVGQAKLDKIRKRCPKIK